MKTAEQIREQTEYHQAQINWLESALKSEIARLQGDAQYASENPMPYDFTYHLGDHARKIEQTKTMIHDHMKAIELLEWVLAE